MSQQCLRSSRIKVGVHTSIAGGLPTAVERAVRLGCDGFQIFARNPRGWKARSLEATEIEEFRAARRSAGLWPLVIHSVYLLNLAAQNSALLEKSRLTFLEEILRGLQLGAEYLVLHPGNPISGSPDLGIQTLVESIRWALNEVESNHREPGVVDSTNNYGLTILIENSAGQGSSIGRSFEQLADILSGLEGLPVGICLDTAHAFASGYDISTLAGLKKTLRSIENSFGLDRVKLIHCNDSKAPLGSCVDRHQHIGFGYIGAAAFRRLTRSAELRSIPFILETPIDQEGDDQRNLGRIRELAGGRGSLK